MRELGAALLDDTPVDEHVDEVRLDVVEDPLVVGDHERAHVGADELLHAAGDDLERVDVEPESVSSSTAMRGFSIAICRISTRFFSPPEKPSLR